MKEIKNMQKAIKQYVKLKWPLVTIPAGEKGPKARGWQNKVPTEEEVLSELPCNIGLNFTQSNLLAVDRDTEEQEAVYNELFGDIKTATMKTPHGRQSLFTGKERLSELATAVYKYRGVDFRLGLGSKGAQSVLPPSITDDQERFWEQPPTSIAELPDSVVAFLLADHKARKVCEAYTPADSEFLGSNSPGDDFCRRATWAEIVEPCGWKFVGSECWQRPGKEKGVSATTYCKSNAGRELFYCFTCNAPPLKEATPYSKFALFTFLNHGGDFKAAAADLASKGYGTQTPEAICIACGAVRGDGVFTFSTYAEAKAAGIKLGFDLTEISDRPVNFRLNSNTVVVTAIRQNKEAPTGWAMNQRTLSRVFTISRAESVTDFDSLIRQVVNNDDGTFRDGGYWNKVGDEWAEANNTSAQQVLANHGIGRDEIKAAMGAIKEHPFFEVNNPYQPEYDGRNWNRFGAKLRYEPSELGPTPYWDRVFNHCGEGLDDAVAESDWCKRFGVKTGGDYLRRWTASLIQYPTQKLPYIFSFSEGESGQETGKSTWPRSVDLLFSRGSVDGESALSEKYNAQLAGAVFMWIEEVALDRRTYYKIKRLVDSPRFNLRAMRKNAYSLPNHLHCVQSGNHDSDCPIELGDTRVVFNEVPPLDPAEWLDWLKQLKPRLEAEAPAFMANMRAIKLPEIGCKRFYLPVLVTAAKERVLARLREKERDSGRQTLLEAVIKLAKSGPFRGNLSKLAVALGPSHGEWSSTARHLSTQLDELELKKSGIQFTRIAHNREVKISLLEGQL
jgi:hypothetical protein